MRPACPAAAHRMPGWTRQRPVAVSSRCNRVPGTWRPAPWHTDPTARRVTTTRTPRPARVTPVPSTPRRRTGCLRGSSPPGRGRGPSRLPAASRNRRSGGPRDSGRMADGKRVAPGRPPLPPQQRAGRATSNRHVAVARGRKRKQARSAAHFPGPEDQALRRRIFRSVALVLLVAFGYVGYTIEPLPHLRGLRHPGGTRRRMGPGPPPQLGRDLAGEHDLQGAADRREAQFAAGQDAAGGHGLAVPGRPQRTARQHHAAGPGQHHGRGRMASGREQRRGRADRRVGRPAPRRAAHLRSRVRLVDEPGRRR